LLYRVLLDVWKYPTIETDNLCHFFSTMLYQSDKPVDPTYSSRYDGASVLCSVNVAPTVMSSQWVLWASHVLRCTAPDSDNAIGRVACK